MGNQDQYKSSDELQDAGANIQDAASNAKQAFDDISNVSNRMQSLSPYAKNPTPKHGGSQEAGKPENAPSNASNLAQHGGQQATNEGGKAAGVGAGQAAMGTGASATEAAAGFGVGAGEAIGAGAGAGEAAASVGAGAGVGSAAGPAGTAAGTALGLLAAFGKYLVRFLLIISAIVVVIAYIFMSFPSLFMEMMVDKIIEETKGNPMIQIVVDAVTGVFVWMDEMGIQTPMSGYKEQVEVASKDINASVQGIYDAAVEQFIQQAIKDGYDETLTREHVVHATSLESDVSYLQAVYSIVTPLETQSMADLVEKSKSISYFTCLTNEGVEVVPIPQTITKYKEISVTYVDSKDNTKSKTETLYVTNGTEEITETKSVPAYKQITVQVYEKIGNGVVLVDKTYFQKDGTTSIVIQTKEVKYQKIVMLSRQRDGIDAAFSFDREAMYVPNFPFLGEAVESTITNGFWADQTANNYAKMNGLKQMGGSGASGAQSQEPLTEAEIYELVSALDSQNVSMNRRSIICNALSCVGRVPYFWCGRTGPKWDDAWGELRAIEYDGNDKQPRGELWPWGLDCSGFVSWCYKMTFKNEFPNPLQDTSTDGIVSGLYTKDITIQELLPGDILIRDGHTGIFYGFDDQGNIIVIHEAGTYAGCVMGIDNGWSSFWRCTTVTDGQKDYMEENNCVIEIPYLAYE